jgi:starch phosphorylase
MLESDASAVAARPDADAPTRAPERDAVAAFRTAVVDKLTYMIGRDASYARNHDWLMATALAVRDRIIDRWRDATRRTYRDGRKRVYYFSLEFLIGRMLFDALGNLGLTATAREAPASLAWIWTGCAGSSQTPRSATAVWAGSPRASWRAWRLSASRPTATESATTTAPSARCCRTGGARTARGMAVVRQSVEFERPEVSYTIGFGGKVEETRSAGAAPRYAWHPAETVTARLSTPRSPAGAGDTSTRCGLWSARAADPLDLEDFNRGDHVGALADRVRLEAISRVLYPSDETPAGQSCVCGRNSSSPPPLCRTCCAGTSSSTAIRPRSRITPRSSSTIRIPRSRFPS